MNRFEFVLRALRRRSNATAVGLFALGLLAVLMVTGVAGAAPSAVPLGASGSFSVLAGAGITNTGPTTVSGDIGTYPTTTITGASSMTVHGTNHAGDAVTQQAQNDLVTAYNTAAGESPTTPIAADLAGLTLKAGVYNSASTIGLSGALTLDAAGDPNAVFVFQAGSALTTGSGSSVNLINGAQACNVFWQIGSSATIGTGSSFRGTIIALTSITVTTGATVDGRVLARNGAVTLDTNTITSSACATAPATTTATTTAATTTAAATTTTTAATTTTVAPKPKPKPKPKPVVKKPVAKVAAAKKKVVAKPKPKAAVATARFGFTG